MKKNKTKKQLKIDLVIIFNRARPITLIVIIIIIGFLLFFLKNNVYQTISTAEIVTQLKKEVPENELLFPLFEDELNQIENKTKLKTINIPKDPFHGINKAEISS